MKTLPLKTLLFLVCLFAGLLPLVSLRAAPLLTLLHAPPFTGKMLPTPPRQNTPWSPPEGLPGPLVSATIALFQEGMADPRGGDYRQIFVAVGNVWNGGGDVVQTHGWVLPPSANSANTGPRFAVCWNGLVYPVVSVGDRANLSADVSGLIKKDADARTAFAIARAKTNDPWPYTRFLQTATSEYESVSETSFLPLKVCLLLRLGEGELARRFWAAYVGPEKAAPGADKGRPYLRIADEWVWAQFDRAVTAHMRGDDQLSLLTARQLTAVQPQAEAEAKRRGYDVTPSRGVHEAGQPYFPYLDPLPRLLADEERRAASAKPKPVLADILKISDKPARIAALIGALDEVAARQMGQPGGVSPDSDPLVLALVAQGDAAVEPLIHTLRTDTRLTRSVGFGRDFHPGRSLVSVSGAAYAALVDILQTSEFSPAGSPASKADAADAIEAYWDKNKGVSVEERWYRTLADDNAGPKQWLDAAHEIIRPSDEKVRGGWIETGVRKQGVRIAPQGEALRQGHTPSVSNLMARRVKNIVALSEAHSSNSQQEFDVQDATALSLYLADWDPQAALPVLREQFATQRRIWLKWAGGSQTEQDADYLTKLTLARVNSGDPTALNDYVSWLETAPLKDLSPFGFVDFFEPLWRSPDDPAVVRGANFLFLDPHSVWVPLVQDRPYLNPDLFSKLLTSPLLALAAFRQAALASLADKAVLRTVTLGGPAPQSWTYNEETDPYRPDTPQSFPVRRCDLSAKQLSELSGMPAFQYDWPLAKKDAAVAETIARLRRYGANFAVVPEPVFPRILPGEGGSPGPEAPLLRFPRLSHPATAAEVAASRAIFSLGAGARVWPLPKFPLPARWLTDRRYPRHETVWSVADKKYQAGTGYAQDGMVWQAEETADGHRFYGFVGPHDLARVPAEEITFPPMRPDDYNWFQVTDFLDAGVRTGDGTAYSYLLTVPPADPVPVTLRLRSRKGLAQTVSADFLPAHVTPTLLFSPDDPAALPLEPGDPQRSWTTVPPRRAAPAPPAVARTLTPTEDYAAWAFDLRDYYDLSRPGTYRFQFVFAGQPTASGPSAPEVTLRVPR